MPSEEDRVAALDYLIPQVGAGLSGENAVRAVEGALANSDSLEVKRHLAARMVDIISDDDPGKVKDWILSQPESISAPAIKIFIKNMAKASPRYAIELINVLPDESQKLAIQQFGTTYAQVNPLASAEWALNSELGDAEYNVGFSIAVIWKSRDVSAATHWVNNLRPSPLKKAFADALK